MTQNVNTAREEEKPVYFRTTNPSATTTIICLSGVIPLISFSVSQYHKSDISGLGMTKEKESLNVSTFQSKEFARSCRTAHAHKHIGQIWLMLEFGSIFCCWKLIELNRQRRN